MSHEVDSLTGTVGFGADIGPGDAAHLVFVRSPLAAARLIAVDAEEARAAAGVLGVFLADDLGLPNYTQIPGLPDEMLQPPLARGEVRFVGQRIAAVVAATRAEAVDAAELVVADLEPVEPVLDHRASDRTAGEWTVGEPWRSRPDEVRIELEMRVPRVAPSPLEPTTVVAVPDGDGGLTVHAGCQLPMATHAELVAALGLTADRLRLLGPPMGGAFGAKTVGASPDLTVPAAIALALGRAIRFVEDRSGHTAVNHARDQYQTWTLVAGPDGRLRHVELDTVADAGAYVATGAMEPATTMLMVPGPYRVDSVHVAARAVLTNTAPTGPYRGPGRAEATGGLERAMDVLAAELAIDPAELRRRNLLRPEDLPHITPTGASYDTADLPTVLERALDEIGADDLRAAHAEHRGQRSSRRLGIGISTWVDATAGFHPHQESHLCIDPDGTLRLLSGAAPAGQGHERSFASVVADRLGVEVDDVTLEVPDSSGPVASVGSFGSRGAQVVGNAVHAASEAVLVQARLLAAQLLEAAPDDIVVHDDGRVGVSGVPDRALTLAELGRRSYEVGELPAGVEPGLAAVGRFAQDDRTYPTGCHVAVVEVDIETGGVDLVRLATVTDCGTVVDEPSATGQAMGAMVQGAAAALHEEIAYDADGNLLTGNLASYGVPGATEVPRLDVVFHPTPTDRNPLGAKGVGESGAVGAPAAVQNAVVDALAEFGVRHVEAPCTPERVWQAIRAAGRPPSIQPTSMS